MAAAPTVRTVTQHAASDQFGDIAHQAGLGNRRAEYRPRPTPLVLPLTVAGAIYLITGPETHPIAIGDPEGAAASAIANLQSDLANFTLGATFSRPEERDRVIQPAVTRAQLPDVLARIDRGERLAFGALVIDRDSLTIDGTVIAWSRLQAVSLHDGAAVFNSADSLFRTREPVYTIPDFFVFQEAVRARTGLEWT